jgi:hypothetical protein
VLSCQKAINKGDFYVLHQHHHTLTSPRRQSKGHAKNARASATFEVEIECSEKVQTATIFKTRLSTVRLINKNSNDRLETKPVDKNAVIEWAPFTLVESIDEEKLLQASQALQTDFLSKQKGFLGRELLKGKGNDWVDLVYWENREAAEQASQNAANSPVCYAYFQLMGADHAEPGAGVMHFEQVKTYKA